MFNVSGSCLSRLTCSQRRGSPDLPRQMLQIRWQYSLIGLIGKTRHNRLVPCAFSGSPITWPVFSRHHGPGDMGGSSESASDYRAFPGAAEESSEEGVCSALARWCSRSEDSPRAELRVRTNGCDDTAEQTWIALHAFNRGRCSAVTSTSPLTRCPNFPRITSCCDVPAWSSSGCFRRCRSIALWESW